MKEAISTNPMDIKGMKSITNDYAHKFDNPDVVD